MQAPLAAPNPFEVLHRIGNVNFRAFDLRLRQGAIEQPPGRPDEWITLAILLVARLLADKNHPGLMRSSAEHGLRRMAIEIATFAILSGLAQFWECFFGGQKLGCVFFSRKLCHSIPSQFRSQPDYEANRRAHDSSGARPGGGEIKPARHPVHSRARVLTAAPTSSTP